MKTKQFSNGAMDLAGKSYQLKYNIRAIVLFEKLADKPFTLACTSDWVIFPVRDVALGSTWSNARSNDYV